MVQNIYLMFQENFENRDQAKDVGLLEDSFFFYEEV
jgi:hypothetical protein